MMHPELHQADIGVENEADETLAEIVQLNDDETAQAQVDDYEVAVHSTDTDTPAEQIHEQPAGQNTAAIKDNPLLASLIQKMRDTITEVENLPYNENDEAEVGTQVSWSVYSVST